MKAEVVAKRRAGVENFYDRVLPAARVQAAEAARARKGKSGRFGPSGRLVRQVPLAAVMNAVETEGREVLSEAAEGYWRDQERRHPEIGGGGTAVIPGRRNRFGRVTASCVNGVWVKRS